MIGVIAFGIVALSFLAIFFIIKRLRKLDFSEKDKYRQIVYILYGAAAVLVIMLIDRYLLRLFKSLMGLPFWESIWSALNIKQSVDFIEPVLMIAALNIVSALLFLLFKLIVKKFAVKYQAGGKGSLSGVYSSVTSYFYQVDGSSYPLLNKRVIFKKSTTCLYILAWVFFLCDFLYIIIAALNPSMIDGFIKVSGYLHAVPILTVLFFREFKSYLDGAPAGKDAQIDVEEVDIKKESAYAMLAEAYEKTFTSHFVKKFKYPDDVDAEKTTIDDHDDVRSVSSTENEPEIKVLLENTKAHLKAVCNGGLNTDLFKMLIHLNRGKNVAVNASVYSDARVYLLSYLRETINGGGTVLCIGKTRRKCDQIMDFIGQQPYEETSVLPNRVIWNIQNIHNAVGDDTTDILFVSPQDLLDNAKMNLKKHFFERLKLVMVLDAHEIMLKDSFLPLLVGWEINYRTDARQIQYVFLMEHCGAAARDAFCHTFQLDEIEIINDVREMNGEIYQLFWRSEGEYSMQNHWLERTRSYYGNRITLGAFGVDHGIQEVFFPSELNFCYHEALDNLTSDGVRFNYRDQLENRISVGRRRMADGADSFVIANDYMNNISLMMKTLSRWYGMKHTMIHLISRPYLLREYFYDTGLTKLSGNDQFQLIPSINLLEQNVIYNVLCEMHNRGMQETVLLDQLKDIAREGSSVQRKLKECLNRINPARKFSLDDVYAAFEFKKCTFFSDHAFHDDYVITLKDNELYQQIMHNIRLVKMCIANVGEKELDCVNVNIPQNYIEGQRLIHEGHNYLIQHIDEKTGRIFVQNEGYECPVPVYVQNREYSLGLKELHCYEKKVINHLDLGLFAEDIVCREGVSLFCTDITVRTKGYYSLYTGAPFDSRDRYNCIHGNEGTTRHLAFCQCLMLSYRIDSELDREKIAFTLAVLIQELLKTLFPYLYQYLSVVPLIQYSNFDPDNAVEKNLRRFYPSCSYFEYEPFKDLEFNLNLVIIEDSAMDVGAVRTIYSEIAVIYDILNDYLDWFLNKRDAHAKSYLHFGQEEVPSCLDLDAVKKLVYSLSNREKDVPVQMKEEDLISVCACSFCGEIIHSAEYHTYSDGRICCQKCFATNVRDETKLYDLYKEARAYLCDRYQIADETIPKNLVVRFRAATGFSDAHPSETGGRVVGLAKYAQNELWVETAAPEMSIRDTLAHELTHFWQFSNIDFDRVPHILIEGHASYVGLEYYRYLNCPDRYGKEKAALEKRQDEYGQGYNELCRMMAEEQTENPFEWLVKHYPRK